MKTLFLAVAIPFAISAMGWFFTWAIWIHAPAHWYGPQSNPLLADSPNLHSPSARCRAWYLGLKVATLVLLAASAVALALWHHSE